jgi:vancomycin resistance protein YoaR
MPRHVVFRRRRWKRAVLIAVPAVIVVLLLAAWSVDTRGHDGRVARNVSLAGHGLGGDSRDQVTAEVDRQADAARNVAVHIVTPTTAYDTTAEALGLSIDQPATVDAVMEADHGGNVLVRPFRWVASLFSTKKVTPRFRIDRAVTADGARALEGAAHVDPVEPALTVSQAGGVEVVPGKPGTGIDANRLSDALLAAAPSGSSSEAIEVHVDQGTLAPRFTDAAAQQVAEQANTLAHHSLTVTIGAVTKPLDPATVGSWLRAVPKNDALTVGIDDAATTAGIAALFGAAGQPPVDASFTVENGKPVLHPSQDGTGCCEPGASQKVFAALQSNTPTLTLSVVTQHAKFTTDAAQQLGIIEEVGQPDMFGPTTHHACCQSRVTNIHLIADIVRGHVILPGETFSVNDFVGQRTAARGFVDAPVIYDATESHDIGGGVSQFATTLFNASFFSGLDLVSYQSHSEYISRYPRGREATISWPSPDLKVKNSTPYGLLLWPTYDDTTLTVHVYSTHYVDVSAGPTQDAKSGVCTRVTTPRVRTYLDGHVDNDSVSALYQPADGVHC